MSSSLLKQLVTGEDSCTAGAGPSRNAVGSLSDALFGGSSRLMEQTGRTNAASTSLTGRRPADAVHERAMAHAGVGDNPFVGDFLSQSNVPRTNATSEAEMFERVFAQQQQQRQRQQQQQHSSLSFHPEQDAVVEETFRGFIQQQPSHHAALPMTGPPRQMTVKEQCHVRDRSTILARQLFADRGDAFVNHHVEGLLRSLNIDQQALPREASGVQGWDGLWNKTTVAMDHAAGVSSYSSLKEEQEMQHLKSSWAEEFVQSAGDKHVSWADEFEQQQHDTQLAGIDKDPAISSVSTIEHTRRLTEALSAETDPKFKNSQFLQFVSKMSRGELVVDGNDVRAVEPVEFPGRAESNSFVDEYLDTRAGSRDWAEQFASGFGSDTLPETSEWVQDFVRQAEGGTWADEFAAFQNGFSSSGGYKMAADNPFLTDTDSFAKGRELFQQGILTESMLAIEAECTRRPDNVEAWTLLGKVNAENDDDVQAIEAMKRGLAVDPNSLELLLSLGVSYTNEFDQKNAVEYLRRWLATHPRYGTMMRETTIPMDSSQEVSHTIYLYKTAAQQSPDDADVHAALGVLCNLARQYNEAVVALRHALSINEKDYSLWNKLGATLANSGRSGEALDAYRRALDAKPNYMRGWTNLGISLANLGKYEESARYYCRALSLNRFSSSVWGYLRTSLICGAREDLLHAVDECNLEELQRALPL